MRLVLILSVCWLWTAVPPSLADDMPTPLAIAERLMEAFNRHDPEAMSSLVTEDFELFYFNNEGKAELSVTGREALKAEMTDYFKTRPDVRSKIADAIGGTNYVSFREQIVGGASSLAVYEVREGLIRRVWYYPAERPDETTQP